MKNFIIHKIIMLIIMLLILNYINVFGQTHNGKKCVMVILPELNYAQFTGIGEINKLLDTSAIGIMNIRGNSINSVYSSYASINTGTKADGKKEHSYIEKTANGYTLVNFNDLLELNRFNHYDPQIGMLGDKLEQNNLKSSIISFAEDHNEDFAPSSLILVNKTGEINNVDFINIDNTNVDIDYIGNIISDTIKENNITILDAHNFKDTNLLIKESKETINKDDLLIIFSPFYSLSSARKGDRLTPILISGMNSSVIYSNTTRRRGVISNIDITPTILSFFNIESNTTGEKIISLENSSNTGLIKGLVKIISFNTKNRFTVLKSYILFQIILLFSIYGVINIKRGNIREKLYLVLKYLNLFTLLCPFILLVMPIFKITELKLYFITGIGINIILLVLLCNIMKSDVGRVIIVSLLTSATIIIDIVTGTNLGKFSLLSYDPVIGARYYGLGNEYMGILISSTLVGLSSIFNRYKKYFISCFIILILVIPIIGLSNFGANVGGTITATMGFGYVVLNYINKRNNLIKNAVLLSLFVVITVSTFSIYDLFFSENKSHLAKALLGFNSEGIGFVLDIIYRKLSMNLKLFFFTIWSQVLIVTLIVLSILVVKPRGLMYHMIKKYSYIAPAWKGSLIAGITGLFVNDSGVVVAATCNIFFAFSLLYLLLGENPDEIRKIRENKYNSI